MTFYLDYDLMKLCIMGAFVGTCCFFFFQTAYKIFFKK